MDTRIETWCGFDIRWVYVTDDPFGRPDQWVAVARDVAVACGTDANYKRKLNTVDPDYVFRCEVSIRHSTYASKARNTQTYLCVNEAGLYAMLDGARRPEIRAFKKWMYDVICDLRAESGFESYQAFDMIHQTYEECQIDTQIQHRNTEANVGATDSCYRKSILPFRKRRGA